QSATGKITVDVACNPSSPACGSSGSGGSSSPYEAATQDCVDTINSYRASVGLPPYQRWDAEESCAGQQAPDDSQTGQAHSAFGICGEWGQNECPGWSGAPGTMIESCLAMMWAEGPGPFGSGHGHYDNMTSTSFTKVACGFYVTPGGSVWATQD